MSGDQKTTVDTESPAPYIAHVNVRTSPTKSNGTQDRATQGCDLSGGPTEARTVNNLTNTPRAYPERVRAGLFVSRHTHTLGGYPCTPPARSS